MKKQYRPQNFSEFVGQSKIKNTLDIMIKSSEKRRKSLDHILIHGSAGLGKTSLASVIANESGSQIRFAQGPLLEKKSDILSLFASITEKSIIFIDEIHGINKSVEELLYSAMEDFAVDIIVGPEGDQKIMRMKLPKFTLIGATTMFSRISKPLRDRFGYVAKLSSYTEEEIGEIVKSSASKEKIKIDNKSVKLISSHSQKTPRIAKQLLSRGIDYLMVSGKKELDSAIVHEMFSGIGIHKNGLRDIHIDFLKCLNENFEDTWASIDTLAGILNVDRKTIESNIEPELLSFSYITKSSRGRKITSEGKNYIQTYNLINKV